MATLDELSAIADRHLPDPVARRWKELLCTALALRPAEPGDTVVGRLGGEAVLPADMSWPTWEEHGPLTLIASFDCALLPRIDFPLPEAGVLQFFFFDGQIDGGSTIVNGSLPETRDGSRVVFIPPGTRAEPRPHPEGITAYDPTEVTAELTYSAPDEQSPVLAAAFEGDEDALAALADDDFIEDLAPWDKPTHQIGGYPSEVQRPPESEIVAGLRPDLEPGTPAFETEASKWRLLLQVGDVDETEMLWGDTGQLYWMARTDTLAASDFTGTAFTWQSG